MGRRWKSKLESPETGHSVPLFNRSGTSGLRSHLMNISVRSLLILAGLSLLGVVTHMVPHEMGVSTVGAVSMLGAAYLPRSLIVIPALVTVLIVDTINGFYAAPAMGFVYLAHLAGVLAVRPFLSSTSVRTVALASAVNALVFYLISHLTPMAMGFYPATVEGWVSCYVNGLPFLWRGIFANLVFGGAAFSAIWLVGEVRARRLFATQRN